MGRCVDLVCPDPSLRDLQAVLVGNRKTFTWYTDFSIRIIISTFKSTFFYDVLTPKERSISFRSQKVFTQPPESLAPFLNSDADNRACPAGSILEYLPPLNICYRYRKTQNSYLSPTHRRNANSPRSANIPHNDSRLLSTSDYGDALVPGL